jgi:hypothetical protein
MRPSHVLHTFLVSPLRLVLDVQLSTGKQHTSGHAKAALGRLLDELGHKRPALVRGDSGYGNEGILLELESRAQPYLPRLRQTPNVQRLVAMAFTRTDRSAPDSQGCQMIGSEVRLHGWSKTRRGVIVRQRLKGGIARQRRIDGRQLQLDLQPAVFQSGERLWEYAVLVTDVAYPIEAIAQLYRDRADAQNAFDELKTCRKAAPTLAMSCLRMLALPCSGVRYSVVWLACLAAVPTAASSSGRLVMASMRAVGCAARLYQLHQL